jgi:hypothetical protein
VRQQPEPDETAKDQKSALGALFFRLCSGDLFHRADGIAAAPAVANVAVDTAANAAANATANMAGNARAKHRREESESSLEDLNLLALPVSGGFLYNTGHFAAPSRGGCPACPASRCHPETAVKRLLS